MPCGDGTGPRGQGPRTGRGMGFCKREGGRQGMEFARGMGFGRGMGRGRFRGWNRGRWTYRQDLEDGPATDESLDPIQGLSKRLDNLQDQVAKLTHLLEKSDARPTGAPAEETDEENA